MSSSGRRCSYRLQSHLIQINSVSNKLLQGTETALTNQDLLLGQIRRFSSKWPQSSTYLPLRCVLRAVIKASYRTNHPKIKSDNPSARTCSVSLSRTFLFAIPAARHVFLPGPLGGLSSHRPMNVEAPATRIAPLRAVLFISIFGRVRLSLSVLLPSQLPAQPLQSTTPPRRSRPCIRRRATAISPEQVATRLASLGKFPSL